MNTNSNKMEQFNIENPPENYSKRSSSCSSQEDYSNENIIFHNELSSVDLQRNDTKELNIAYCGIQGNSDKSAILNIIVSTIGGSCFSYPYIVYDVGILYSLLMFLFVTICIYYSIDLLRSFIVDTKFYSFSLMTEKIAGKTWLKIYGISSFIIYLSMVVNHENMIYSYIVTMVPKQINEYIFKLFYYIGISVVEIIVCVCTRNTKQHLLSIMTLSCLTIILLLLIFYSIYSFITIDRSGRDDKDKISFFPRQMEDINPFIRFLNIISYLVTFVFGYCYHATFPTLIGNLHTVNNTTTRKVHIYSFLIIFAFFFSISFFGCLYESSTGKYLKVLFIENLEDFVEDKFSDFLRITLALFFFTLIPIRFMVVRDSYTTLIGQKKVTIVKEIIITTLFIIISNIIGMLMNLREAEIFQNDVSDFLQIFGGIFGVIICFILPIINYVSVVGKTKVKAIIGYIITGIFCIVCIFTQFYSIYNFIYRVFLSDNHGIVDGGDDGNSTNTTNSTNVTMVNSSY